MDKSFIEVQFPVSKISKESYKERKANLGQTLTGLGKWWGRKPLILVRATILGLLLPSTNNPQKDRDIFLKILAMDDEGLLERKTKSIPLKILYENSTDSERIKYFQINNNNPKWRAGVLSAEKLQFQNLIFKRLNYDLRINFCKRPEELLNLQEKSWETINQYLGTTATSLQQLVQQLSIKRFGEIVTVGDCFCGGGSIPFETARMGLNAYGSDLNPIATLLTWSALNINGAEVSEIENLKLFQKKVYDTVDSQILDFGIEVNKDGWRASAYIYCNETKCPACSWMVPLSPSWVVGKGSKTIAKLIAIESTRSYKIKIESNSTNEDIKQAEQLKTVEDSSLKCPNCHTVTPISSIRKDRKNSENKTIYGLRLWEKNEFKPRPEDVFQERLYCIKYIETKIQNGKTINIRHYKSVDEDDLIREKKVETLLSERFQEWQNKGYLPSERIEIGDKTKEPIRNRGWQYWHHLFNPRQLLINGLLLECVDKNAKTQKERAISILGVNKSINWGSKLSMWNNASVAEKPDSTFINQALNTLTNYGCRAFSMLETCFVFTLNPYKCASNSIKVLDARSIQNNCNFWITDPPYADAVNYHELSEFFLAWDKKLLKKTFPEWYVESKRNEAVKGNDQNFTRAMIEVYRNLANNMPDDGMQVVMFTHQDPAVWAELRLILIAAGLRVTAAWSIATETESGGLKSGNYVKGTVLLVLRKNNTNQNGWSDDIYPIIKDEVKLQIESMKALDDKDDPDFTDNDYLLAAYAASMKVLTNYKTIDGVDVETELSKKRDKNVKGTIQGIIESSIKVAYDYLIPKGISRNIWKEFSKEEKFYIKGLEFERNGIFAISAYLELARGFGINDYSVLLSSAKANNARVKTALEFANKQLSNTEAFSKSLVRQTLMAIYLSIKDEDAMSGKNWFRNEVPDYWNNRTKIIEILKMIKSFQTVSNAEHWQLSAQYAGYLQSLVENDGL